MHNGNVTTPVGRRPMTLALVKRQLDTAEIKSGKTADKWKVFRDCCEARVLLGVQDRALAVLDALLTFYPHAELAEEKGLIVFPSNVQLSLRAHGIAGTTLRRHLAALVDAGLILRKDSPNGKRYARRDREGDVDQAFGFSLAPLLSRSEELAHMAQKVVAERRQLREIREAVSLKRRDLRKLISAAIEEGAAGDWGSMEASYLQIVAQMPRTPTLADLQGTLMLMDALFTRVVKALEMQLNSQKTDVNDDHFGRHKQNSNTDSINELEPSSREEQGRNPTLSPGQIAEPLKSFPLAMVLKACPDICDYGGGGTITSWRDLMSAAVVVRSMLGVSPSAYEEACEVMGPENAAAAMACILERASHINSPGGYLRDLTTRSRKGEFSLGPMLMSLMRANGSPGKISA